MFVEKITLVSSILVSQYKCFFLELFKSLHLDVEENLYHLQKTLLEYTTTNQAYCPRLI